MPLPLKCCLFPAAAAASNHQNIAVLQKELFHGAVLAAVLGIFVVGLVEPDVF